MLNALQSVFSIIMMIALGFTLAKRKWFDAGSSALLSRPPWFPAFPYPSWRCWGAFS